MYDVNVVVVIAVNAVVAAVNVVVVVFVIVVVVVRRIWWRHFDNVFISPSLSSPHHATLVPNLLLPTSRIPMMTSLRSPNMGHAPQKPQPMVIPSFLFVSNTGPR